MKGSVLLLSDIHADPGALDAILRVSGDEAFARRFGIVKRALNLGDVVERGYHPCETIDRMKGIPGLRSVLGNHDEAFVYQYSVSGSDEESREAHEQCRMHCDWQGFFRGMGDCETDLSERLYAVHGGPVDPDKICPAGADDVTKWLHSRTWQRISRAGKSYYDESGYHYTPEEAFAAVREIMPPGFTVLCGHEHAEAAFMERDGDVTDILFSLETVSFGAGGRRVEEKTIELEEDVNYLVRLGIAGPAGYYVRYGWDRCYFGVYHRKGGQRFISMLSFPLGRDAVPP